MERDEEGIFAVDIFLPPHCPRRNLIMTGVCCYRYKFYVDMGSRQRWLHDPRQPMDKDASGWVNNFLCKYAHSHDGTPLRMLPTAVNNNAPPEETAASGGGVRPTSLVAAQAQAAAAAKAAAAARSEAAPGRQALSAAAVQAPPPPPGGEVCFSLPATYFNGTSIGARTTRGIGGCCEVCRRRPGCSAYTWRPEPVDRNCVLFGKDRGTAKGTALTSAGLVRVPLSHPTASAALHASPPPPLPPSPLLRPLSRKRGRKRKPRRKQHAHTSGGGPR